MPLGLSLPLVARVLKALAKPTRITKGSLDGQPITITDSAVTADMDECNINCTFRCGSDEYQLNAHHTFAGGDVEDVKINGTQVQVLDVQQDVDGHFLYAMVEYWLDYQMEGTAHQLYLAAKVRFF